MAESDVVLNGGRPARGRQVPSGKAAEGLGELTAGLGLGWGLAGFPLVPVDAGGGLCSGLFWDAISNRNQGDKLFF